ncbi:ABC transporter ATP-binding protein [Microbacterium sp. VKM Ac-2923]|uniref:ABC transporter transmembrane domain-containing protein n=1 Tax=Microbacterium sp. VKM Ac-2923 TaxID=2929476 RepID=UPI001FB3E340|nr:ABC transporter ATP-binding protein [Microbacterium sp. VKM Ac-2923]MCJ1708515.1 ABC transporter ATP-binding protein/permease [Microbacterium sp. VKM Ac-2923]
MPPRPFGSRPTPRRGRVLLASLGFSLHQACEALVPIVVGITIDIAIAPSDPWMLALALVCLAAVFVVLRFMWRMGELAAVAAFVERVYARRRTLVSRLLAPRSGYDGTGAEALSTIGSDTDEEATVVWTISRGIASGAAAVTAAIALLLISPLLAVLVLVGTPVLMLVMHVVTRPLERRSAGEQAALAETSALVGDLLSGLRTVKGLSAEDEAIRRFRAMNMRAMSAALRAANAEGAFAGVSAFISGAFVVLLAALASGSVLSGEITPGQLVIVIGLAQFLQTPIAGLGFVGAELARARASRRRVDALLSAPSDEGEHLPAGPGRVRVRGLALPSGTVLDLDVRAGELVGLTLDEADATAVLAQFAGTGDAGTATLSIDGAVLSGPPAAGHPPTVLAAPHEIALFTGDVAANVRPASAPDGAGAEAGTGEDADLHAVAEAAALHDVLSIDGWTRHVGERGRLLSGGQRQRVGLARALAADAPVLVLREPAISVDAVTQARLADGIRRHRRDRTTLLLTASPALLSVCDRVVAASVVPPLSTSDRGVRS